MAMPPSKAVGCWCHRSMRGCATYPYRRASNLTTGVSARESTRAPSPPANAWANMSGGVQVEGVVDGLQDAVQRQCRTVADEAMGLLDRRNPTGHVLEPRGIGLVIRDEPDRGTAPGQPLHALGQLQDRDLLGAAQVEDLPDRAGVLRERDDGLHDVADPRKAAPLAAVAVDGDRFMLAGLGD